MSRSLSEGTREATSPPALSCCLVSLAFSYADAHDFTQSFFVADCVGGLFLLCSGYGVLRVLVFPLVVSCWVLCRRHLQVQGHIGLATWSKMVVKGHTALRSRDYADSPFLFELVFSYLLSFATGCGV